MAKSVAFFVLVALLAAGCAGRRVQPALPGWVTAAAADPARASRLPAPRAGVAGVEPAADLVVAALQAEGARFGTDGSVGALWGYLRHSARHREIEPGRVEPGDVLFFQRYPDRRRDCENPDHVGLVVAASPEGRVTFLEERAGATRRSYVAPRAPETRRDENGVVLNTYLRPRRLADSDEAPLLAGQMLCAAIRPAL